MPEKYTGSSRKLDGFHSAAGNAKRKHPMSKLYGLGSELKPDWAALAANVLRKGTPKRVHHIELFQDAEVRNAIAARFNLMEGVSLSDPDFERKKLIAVQRFCGFDYVRVGLVDVSLEIFGDTIEDTSADLKRSNGRRFVDENAGPIRNWSDFEQFRWPNPKAPSVLRELEWFDRNLPEDMCIIGSGGFAHFAEYLTWIMGYQTFCLALYDQRDLVKALADRLKDFYRDCLDCILQFDRVKIVWGSDDMGHKTGLLFSPDDMREFVLSGHKLMAEMSHAAGRPYLLHSCGNLADIIDDLIDDVGIDGKHSFEDTIEDVRSLKRGYGSRTALLGGIDVDFLCRSGEREIRKRVRDTLDICMSGGGYCLGTGNSVANYIPLDNYLAMVDEGRLYGG